MEDQLTLREVDSVEIISLIDNTVDLNSIVQNREVQKIREWTKKH